MGTLKDRAFYYFLIPWLYLNISFFFILEKSQALLEIFYDYSFYLWKLLSAFLSSLRKLFCFNNATIIKAV